MNYSNLVERLLVRLVNLIPRHRFGKFLKLDNLKSKILQAATRKEEAFPELVISYISAAFLIPACILRRIRWDVILLMFSIAASKNVPSVDIPMLKPFKHKDDKAIWDYESREYALYVHIIAQAYGWEQKVIDDLDIDTALALIQEIITDEQIDREFLWSMSDRSYIYNTDTKTGKPNPLDRPHFMKMEAKPPPTTKILKSMMPVGSGRMAKDAEELRNLPPLPPLKGLRP